MNKLTSIGLAAAFAASAGALSGCGARTGLSDLASGNDVETADTGGDAGNDADAGVPDGGNDADAGGDTEGGSDGGVKFGTITIRNNGSLDPIVDKQPDKRIARFELAADAIEDQRINEICLKVKVAGCETTGISDPVSLFVEGKNELLATGVFNNTGWYGDVCFTLPVPYTLAKGQSKIFNVSSTVTAHCCHSTVESYLVKAADLKATGMTYGQPSEVDNNYGETDAHSSFESWWGKFQVSFNGPPSSNIPTGTEGAHCMDLFISNCLPNDVDIKDWVFGIEIPNGDPLYDTKDLNDDFQPATPNFKLVKMVQINTDGTNGPTIFGPNELDDHGSDVTQALTLNGKRTIAKGTEFKAAVVFDVEDNQTLAGNQVRCILKNLLQGDKVTVGGQPIDASKINPNSDLTGNIHTIVAEDFPCVQVEPASVPVGAVIQKGSSNVNFACWDFTNANSCNLTTLRTLIATHYGVGSYGDLLNYRLYQGATAVSDFENINLSSGTITFDNLSVPFVPGTTTTLCAHADVSNNADTASQHGLELEPSYPPDHIILKPAKKIDGQFPVQGPIFMIAQ